MKNYKYINILYALIFTCIHISKANCQATSANLPNANVPFGASDYLGWKTGVNRNLVVKNEDPFRINFYTNAGSGPLTNLRMTIFDSAASPINAGYIGIGYAYPTAIIGINGDAARTIKMEIPTTANTAGHSLTISSGSSSEGTDLAGGNLVLKSGASTGTVSSQMQFWTATGSGSSGTLANNATQKMVITGGGRVGISSTNPQSLLHQHAGGNVNTYHQFTTGRTTQLSQANGFRLGITDRNGLAEVDINQQEVAPMRLYTSGTERLTILSGGNVGIGIISPSELFHVKSTAAVPGYTTLIENANTGTAAGSYIGLHATSTFSRTGSANNTSNIAALFEAGGGRFSTLGVNAIVTGVAGTTQFASGGNFEGHGGGEVRGLVALGENGTSFNYGVIATAASAGTAATNIGISSTASGSGGTGGTHKAGYFSAANGTSNYGVDALASQSGAATNYGVNAVAQLATTNNYGLNAEAGFGTSSIGVNGWCHNATTEDIGVKGLASGTGSATNYGVYGAAQTGTKNYGVYGVAAQNTAGCTSVGTTCSDAAGYFAGDLVWTGNSFVVSDKSLKQNISPLNSLAIIKQLQPKKFEFKTQQFQSMNLPDGIQYGLIAENVDSILPSLTKIFIHPANYDVSGNLINPEVTYTGVNYVSLVPILLAALKAEQIRIDSLVTAIANGSRTAGPAPGESEGSLYRVNLSGSQQEAILYQNEPNPFSNQTKIRYFIPENAGKAVVTFYDNTGKPMKETVISEKGQGTVEVDASGLSSSIYTYSLVIDGKVIDTKHMVKVK